MNKKIILPLVAMTFAMSLGVANAITITPKVTPTTFDSLTASANSKSCQIAKNNANYYCNATDNLELCRYWKRKAQACGPLEI